MSIPTEDGIIFVVFGVLRVYLRLLLIYLITIYIDFLQPLELSPSGWHRFHEGTQGLAE